MSSKITIIGAGLAALAVVDTLLQNSVSPQEVIMIHEGVDPWNRNEFYGFGGNTWTDQLTLSKDPQELEELNDYLDLLDLKAKIQQATEFITRYTNGGVTDRENCIELDTEATTYLTRKTWADFRNKQVTIEDKATCRPITQISNYIIYDKEEADYKQEQQFTKLVLATGNSGYGTAHSLGEYAANLGEVPFKISTPSNLQINKNFTLCNMENIYVVGGILGYTNPMISIIQGIVAGESIVKSI